jgi:hypothetical protein
MRITVDDMRAGENTMAWRHGALALALQILAVFLPRQGKSVEGFGQME